MGRNERRVRLGFQWDAGSWDRAPAWFDTLFRTLADQRVHWNLPALAADLPVRRRGALAKALLARVEEHGDLVTSRGYAGACHPLLNLDELDKELAWGLHNPWGTGLTDVLGLKPPVLIPSVADLRRPEAGKAYAAHGFRAVGVCVTPLGAATPAEGWMPVTCLRAALLGKGDMTARALRAATAGSGEVFLLIDLAREESAEHLEQVLDAVLPVLKADGPLSLVEMPAQDGVAVAAAPAWTVDWSAFPGPVVHAAVAAAGPATRKKRKKAEEVQAILAALAPGANGIPRDAAASDDTGNSGRLVAHMLGDVVLAGSAFDVCLAGGRFCGMVRQGREVLPRVPAVSRLRVGSRETPWRTLSSFSFEGESGTGLREELSLDGRGASSLSIEYSFQEDSNHLSIRGAVRFPPFPDEARVSYAPLSFALREVSRNETVDVSAAAPDGSTAVVRLAADDVPVVLPGARMRVPRPGGGWIALSYAGPDDGTWGLASLRITRVRGRRLLVINPFGSDEPVPGAALSGRRETFSLLVGVEDS